MQFKTFVAVAFASLASACTTESEAGSTCVTSGGAWLYILSPYANTTYDAGSTINLQWDFCGTDAAFSNATVIFSLVDASNPNDAVDISNGGISFATPSTWGSGQATGTIPAGVSGSKISVKSTYHDSTKFDFCFGNVFTIVSSSGSSPSSSSSSSSTSTTAAKSSAQSMAAAGAAVAVVAALML
ncbi:hypothetical protein HK100_000191 [Physocladia obscura]|uniref:Uncharacterized protein n=1 Tax=Physocladia obscura TaxID=109957 RepID=A0AAD5SYS4_9FUNG|nr:hypothetical protein HK100_000191 [Physocladia obscura]